MKYIGLENSEIIAERSCLLTHIAILWQFFAEKVFRVNKYLCIIILASIRIPIDLLFFLVGICCW